MSIYERRWNYVAGNVSCYTDDVARVLRAIREHGVDRVSDGYADDEYLPEHGGTLYTRRTERVLTAAEFVAEFGEAV